MLPHISGLIVVYTTNSCLGVIQKSAGGVARARAAVQNGFLRMVHLDIRR